MVHQNSWSWTGDHNLHPKCSGHFSKHWILSLHYQQHTIHRLMGKQTEPTKSWGNFCEHLLIFDRAIGPSFYLLLNFHLILGPIWLQAIHLSTCCMGLNPPLDLTIFPLCRHQQQTKGSRCRREWMRILSGDRLVNPTKTDDDDDEW